MPGVQVARGLTVFLYGLGTYFFAFTITSLIIKINQQKNRPKWHCVLCLTSTSSVHYTRQPQSSAWSEGDICAFLCLSQGHSYCENSHVRCTSLYFWVFMPLDSQTIFVDVLPHKWVRRYLSLTPHADPMSRAVQSQ